MSSPFTLYFISSTLGTAMGVIKSKIEIKKAPIISCEATNLSAVLFAIEDFYTYSSSCSAAYAFSSSSCISPGT